MAKRQRNYITVYEVFQCYGGAEEGGWYYTVYEPVKVRKASTMKAARAIQEQLAEDFGRGYIVHIEKTRELLSWDNTNEPRPVYC